MKFDLGKIVAGGLLLAAGLVLGMVTMQLRDQEPAEPIKILPPAPTPTTLPTTTPSPILVYVSGEVLDPDVYALDANSRIKQLVEAAGGFTGDANTAAVNLAQPLTDGAHVHIPAEGEAIPTPPERFSAPVSPQTGYESDIGAGGKLVNINTADLEELDTLPGIGPALAQKILDYRAVNGPFANLEALMEVSGIGQVKFDKIKQLITLAN